MMELNSINLITGILILILNLIPLIFKKPKYFGITLPLSLLIALIRVLFVK
jgi:hypothetical protein